jgi:transposase
MEASGGAHYWARQLTALGHEVRLMSPALVMPYRKGNKTDRNDADAILEAVTRPSMRFAMVKSVAQQDVLALHRVRAQLVKSRTALCNQLRGWARRISAERGPNVAAVALANKNARVLWALLARGDRYRSTNVAAHAVLRSGSPPAIKRARSVKLRVRKD